MSPGEIRWFDDGESQFGARPVLILSTEKLSRGRSVIIAPITSQRVEERRRFSNCVFLRAGRFGVDRDCVVQLDQIHVVEVEFLGPCRGTIDETTHREVIAAVGFVVDAECYPSA